MTWKTSKKASDTYSKLSNACNEFKFDIPRTFVISKRVYTFEPDYVTHDDGSITGDLYTIDQAQNVKSIEQFKIDANGVITQGAPLKKFAKKMIRD